jgi:hypothetical protein
MGLGFGRQRLGLSGKDLLLQLQIRNNVERAV